MRKPEASDPLKLAGGEPLDGGVLATKGTLVLSLSELYRFLPAEPVRVHSAPPLANSRSLHTRCLSGTLHTWCLSEAWMILNKLLGGSYLEAPHAALVGSKLGER